MRVLSLLLAVPAVLTGAAAAAQSTVTGPFPVPLGQKVAEFEIEVPDLDKFVLHGPLPVPPGCCWLSEAKGEDALPAEVLTTFYGSTDPLGAALARGIDNLQNEAVLLAYLQQFAR